jgi:putative ABC transport system permease protein
MNFLRRLWYSLRHRNVDDELAEELESHRAMTQTRLEGAGLSAPDAAAESRRLMGNLALAREDARAERVAPWLDGAWQDLRYGIRSAAHQPGFAAVAIVTLAAAIGLNTTVFTIFNALVLAPWPVADPAQVVTIHNTSAVDVSVRGGGAPGGFSLDEADYFRANSRTLTGFTTVRTGGGDQTLGDDDTPASWVSGDYFSLLGVKMALGRGFAPDEDVAAAPAAVAVLSYGYWTRSHGRDPAVVGRSVQLEGIPFTVIGVAAPEFTGTTPDRIDVWLPMASTTLLRPDDRWTRNVFLKRACCVQLAGRLTPGVSREEAAAELTVLNRGYRGDTDPGGVRIAGTQFASDAKANATSLFTPMFLAVVLVLSLACANVGNLLLARATARRREIAVRLALGASRARIVRQLLTESLVLAVVAGAIGIVIALWAPSRLMTLLAPTSGLALRPDTLVLTFTAGLTLLSCALFGLLPALHGARTGVSNALKSGPLPRLAGLSVRNVLLGVQVAIAVVLVSTAGLLTRAVIDANSRAVGYSMRDVTTISFTPPARGFDASRIRDLSRGIASGIEPLLASGQAALTSTAPLASGNIKGGYHLPGDPTDRFNAAYEVSTGYFELLQMPLLLGRTFQATDADQDVIVINETMARQHWPAESAVGRTVLVDERTGGWNRPGELRVIGVVRDAAMTNLTSVEPTIYQPLSGRGLPQAIVRDGTGAQATVIDLVSRLEPRMSIRARPLSSNLSPQVRRSRVAAILSTLLGALALLLACVGMAGVFGYVVQQRTHEIGVHMALGARVSHILGVVVRSSLLAIAGGAVAGLVGAFLASGLLRSYLFGLSAADPLAHLGVLVVLALAGSAATFVPARNAARIEPVNALRHE